MSKKLHSGMMLTLLLISTLTLAFNIQPAKASGTIYIRSDGSVDPPTTPISSVDNVTYTFTDNNYDEIVVQRDNIVVDGAGCLLQGGGYGKGFYLQYANNVTIENTGIKNFDYGVYIDFSSNNTIIGNNITDNYHGIILAGSYNTISGNNITDNWDGIHLAGSYNTISGNNITDNYDDGIYVSWSYNTISGNDISNNYDDGVILQGSSNNTISGNSIANNGDGVRLWDSLDNSIVGNSIADSEYGIRLSGYSGSSNNFIYHNNFEDNTEQVHFDVSDCANIWDDGYPAGGNYWSDYGEKYPDAQELDGSGIWDTPYEIDVGNQDNYPLMEPWTAPTIPTTIDELKTEIEELGLEGEIDNQGIVTSLIAKLNVAQKLVDKGKINEAKSILEEDFIPQVLNLSGIHTTVEAAELLIESAEHVISNH